MTDETHWRIYAVFWVILSALAGALFVLWTSVLVRDERQHFWVVEVCEAVQKLERRTVGVAMLDCPERPALSVTTDRPNQ